MHFSQHIKIHPASCKDIQTPFHSPVLAPHEIVNFVSLTVNG